MNFTSVCGRKWILKEFNSSDIKFNDGFFTLFNQINEVYTLALVTATSEKIFNILGGDSRLLI